ncbi:MAG: GH116 family glycosyl-hydrolase [Verrucomicrobiota bacterium]
MRNCNCSGICGPQTDGLTRRKFIGLVGAGTAATLFTDPAWAAFDLPADELERWKRDLLAPAQPRLYRSDTHTDARMHLGGIGTGNIEIGADGQLTTWQLFNTLRDGHVPLYFAVKAGSAAKLLQTAGGPGWPRVQQIEMTGEYPCALLRFRDTDLPVQLELTAFSPFAPLDTKLSSMPLAVFIFRIHNPSAQPQTVSLAAMMTNPVGFDAAGKIEGVAHPNFGGNVNEPFQDGRASGLFLRAPAGQEPGLDKAVAIYTLANLRGLNAPPPDRPKNLAVEILEQPLSAPDRLKDPARTVIWLEEAPADLAEPILRSVRDAVQAGATLLFSGQAMPLVRAYAQASGGKPLDQSSQRPDILFADFERSYGDWKIEGKAFGEKPADGTLPNQQRVSGFLGQGLVNTYLEGDDTTGHLISKPFTIERQFIRFLIGGGHYATTQIRLMVGGQTVRATSGRDNERLLPASWDVREFQGQAARLEIVDDQTGGWGHVNADHIEFSDQPGNRALLALLEELLPAWFSGLRPSAGKSPADPNALEFEDLELRAEAKQTTARNSLRLLSRPFGQGQVVLAAGPVLDVGQAELTKARQRAYAVLCELVGASYVASGGTPSTAPGFGTLALATLGQNPTALSAFDDWSAAWKTFATQGRFTPLAEIQPTVPTPDGRTVNGAVASTVTVTAGGTVEVPFLLGWHYPNKYNGSGAWMGCHYATQWPDARAVVLEAAADFATLRKKTELFRKTFYDSTLPYWLLDCCTSQASILRHIGVVFRIANGDIYGWEGSNGCCQPTCTHVWGYEQTLSRLFPDLEKEMRRIDFKHQQRADGGVNNRSDVPSPPRPTGEQPFADGHASCILKAYREALNSPDDSFFREYWPHIQRAVDYLIARDAKSHGGQAAGYLEDDQWNTYDEALHGVTTFISGYYLAALRAGEEWARRLGDTAAADRFHGVFEKGQQKLIDLCWNGEYFQQHLPDYLTRPGEVGPGCMSDQLIGQWWAHQLGLGYLLPKDKVQSALRAVFKHNFKSDLTGWQHSPRAFAGAKDKGLIICTWPKGGRPGHVMLYSDEVWTGIEYQVAAHLIYEGLVEEGLAIVKAARDRYDGLPRAPIPRNPWNEIECGGHYARAMSSWSLLLALSGYEYDGPKKALRFTPRHSVENCRCFFCGPEGWGTFNQRSEVGGQRSEVQMKWGELRVKTLDLALAGSLKPAKAVVTIAGKQVSAKLALKEGRVEIKLEAETLVREGEALEVALA